MPLYEYRCPKCKMTFELIRPMSRSAEPVPCPRGHQAERLVSLVARTRGGGEVSSMGGGGCACGGGSCGCGH